MVKRIVTCALSVVLIILELLPFGAVLQFADPERDIVNIETYSYFSLTPYGYANFGPFLTALLSVALLVLFAVYAFVRKGLGAVRVLAAVGVLTSLLPLLMFGAGYFTLVGGFITVIFAAELVLSLLMQNNIDP